MIPNNISFKFLFVVYKYIRIYEKMFLVLEASYRSNMIGDVLIVGGLTENAENLSPSEV